MAKSNQSKKKQSKQKVKNNNPTVQKSKSTENTKYASGTQKKNASNKASGKSLDSTPKKGFLLINGLVLKVLLLLFTAIGVVGILVTDANTPNRDIFRAVGAMAIPLSVFLLVEGIRYTSSKPMYFLRLFLWAIAAEAPAYLIYSFETVKNTGLREDFSQMSEMEQFSFLLKWQEFPMLDYMFTLVLTFLLTILLRILLKQFKEAATLSMKFLYGALMVMSLALCIVIAGAAQYGKILGYPVLALMYAAGCVLFEERKDMVAIACGLIGIAYGSLSGPTSGKVFFVIGLALSAFLIKAYDGTLGYNKEKHPNLKYIFYTAYVSIMATSVAGIMIYMRIAIK